MPPRKRAEPAKKATAGRRTLKSVQARNEAVLLEQQNELAKQALLLRRQQVDWWDIAEQLRITEPAAKDAVARAIAGASALVDTATKRELLIFEVEQLNYLQSQLRTQVALGAIPAINAARQIIGDRVKLLGLDQADAASGNIITTVVVQGTSAEYVKALEEISAHNGQNDVVEGQLA